MDRHAAALLDSGELIVGSSAGLHAWLPDGTSQRTVSTGPALHPRRFGREHVVALRGSSGADLRDGAVLELIALANGERRELAQLPAFRCAEQSKPAHLFVADALDFEVDGARRVACISLANASTSAADVRVRARIDLTAGKIERWLALGESDCAAPAGVKVGDPAADGVCWGIAEVARPQPDPTTFPYTFSNEYVRSAAVRGGSKLQVRGYDLELTSPSDRWLLLAGDFTERESTYRRLLLLDRSRGKLFPIVDRAGPWPAPLTAAGSKLTTPIKQAQLVASTTDIRWLGASQDTEVLIVDKLVVRPERAAFQISDGELAR